MATIADVRRRCDASNVETKQTIQNMIETYFESEFINRNKPFKAFSGVRRCKAIPIYRPYYYWYGEELISLNLQLEKFDEDFVRKELEKLGFVLTKDKIRIMVPPIKKGKSLTFAQQWVKRINYNYSRFCKQEYEKGERIYSELIECLATAPQSKIQVCEEYTIFKGIKYEPTISRECLRAIRRAMARDGIEEYFENGEYVGMKIANNELM